MFGDRDLLDGLSSGSDEHDDNLVSFMTPSGEAKQYYWPAREDICWIENSNILCTVEIPTITSLKKMI